MALQLSAFVLLGMAILLCWAPPIRVGQRAMAASAIPAVFALGVALDSHLLSVIGLTAFGLLAAACVVSERGSSSVVRVAARVIAACSAYALATGKVPGFVPIVVIPEQVLSDGAVAFSRRLRFNGAFTGYLVLAWVARPADRPALKMGRTVLLSLSGALVVMLAVAPFAMATGYFAFDPRLPESLAMFAITIAIFTAAPEEAFFRGLLQAPLHAALDDTRWRHLIIPVCAVAFGFVHSAGGPMLMAMAAVSGAVAAVIYAKTRYVAAPIIMHTCVNIVHYTVFTYPRLA